ncbi:competence protein ComGA [Lactobacillus sp. S2-2]|uniref:competence type IV pilus ATPase ComGA n=1 Tax=Lactobacillus sp. S2-2 TaxID=2692917 RepID=UPI001F28766D|nr:competence type IV pilus ATPase ComGA [Lactobacillus sp. S2-2]MCF6515827.1 competence protein ComGA [Lactobacillus sp. S2-2]
MRNIPNTIKQMIEYSISNQVSDIYILPTSNTSYVIKYKEPDNIHTCIELDSKEADKVINLLKFESKMSLSERRRPQLGSFEYEFNDRKLNLRISTVGDFNGNESLVIRIIYNNSSLNEKFYNYEIIDKLFDNLNRRGLVIFSGPTGVGKTSTIYHIAKKIVNENLIMTIEDPVEIYENKFLQLEVNEKADMTYEDLIKVGLRHRPDVFIIGEVRDSETANAAVKAALSGHLVFCSIHSKDTESVIQRFLNFGIERDHLESALNSILYQRLIISEDKKIKGLITMKEGIDDFGAMNYWNKKINDLSKKGIISYENFKKYEFG